MIRCQTTTRGAACLGPVRIKPGMNLYTYVMGFLYKEFKRIIERGRRLTLGTWKLVKKKS